jgi:hypothetical protein
MPTTNYTFDKDDVNLEQLLFDLLDGTFEVDAAAEFRGFKDSKAASPAQNLTVRWENPLSGADQTEQSNIVAAHVALKVVKRSEYTWCQQTTTGGAYAVVGTLPYQGARRTGGPPVLLEAVIGVGSASALDARVYDVTNTTVIAEVLGVTDAYPAFVNMGAISNVPDKAAVWELQIRRASGGGQSNVHGACLLMGY